MRTITIFGLHVPDAGPVFAITLAVHVAAALTCVIAGLLATTARKRPGRHPTAGRVYLVGLGLVCVTATVMAAIRWAEDARLFAIAVIALGLGLFGWQARRQRRNGWRYRHALGMGGSFIALLTGFYVDNGPQLPVGRLLPHWLYWTLPTVIGIPLIAFALHRYQDRISTRPALPHHLKRKPGTPRPRTALTVVTPHRRLLLALAEGTKPMLGSPEHAHTCEGPHWTIRPVATVGPFNQSRGHRSCPRLHRRIDTDIEADGNGSVTISSKWSIMVALVSTGSSVSGAAPRPRCSHR
jgi:hypothetical protein